jgi:menaquinol-cytochrome c reductase iron-sulfur subunit
MTNRAAERAAVGPAAELARRRFFGRVIGAIAALVATAWAVPLAIYAVAPALTRRIREWVDTGAVVDLEVDQPRELDVVVSRRDGWHEVRAVKSFWAHRAQNGEVVAFSAICPHLGCAFQWRADQGRFVCPCHLSAFSLSGDVLAGPSPRPLDRLDVKVEAGRLLVFPQDFKIGVRQKVPI